MALVIQDGDGLGVFTSTRQANDFTDWFIRAKEGTELCDTALVEESLRGLRLRAVVVDDQREARDQIRGLASASINVLDGKLGFLQENLAISPVLNASASYLCRDFANNAQAR